MPLTDNTDEHWSQIYDTGRDFRLITAGELSRILAYTDGMLDKTCLDVGCGTGQLTRELYHRGYSCVGVDAAASAVELAQSLTEVSKDRLRYIHMDIERDGVDKLPGLPYSLIMCKLVYAFIRDKPAFLAAVKSLLVPGGVFAVITPHVADVAAERRGIAVDDSELELLSSNFEQVALYRGSEHVEPLTYFVGR